MRIVIVYESFFGSTRTAAEAIADGIRSGAPGGTVIIVPTCNAAPTLEDVDLLVVGAPTHFLGLSSRVSRWLHAQYWGDPVSPRRTRRPYGRPSSDLSLRRWLHRLPRSSAVRAAAFDTRMPSRLTGHAATAAARRLRRRSLHLIARPEGFLVSSVTGPLAPGEEDRATAWGEGLVRQMVTSRGARGALAQAPVRGRRQRTTAPATLPMDAGAADRAGRPAAIQG